MSYDEEDYSDMNCSCIICKQPHHCEGDCMMHRPSVGVCFCVPCYDAMFRGPDDELKRGTKKMWEEAGREEIERYLTIIELQK